MPYEEETNSCIVLRSVPMYTVKGSFLLLVNHRTCSFGYSFGSYGWMSAASKHLPISSKVLIMAIKEVLISFLFGLHSFSFAIITNNGTINLTLRRLLPISHRYFRFLA